MSGYVIANYTIHDPEKYEKYPPAVRPTIQQYGGKMLVVDRDAIDWTPNTIASKILIEGDIAMIKLTSETPNLKEYQMKEGLSGDWQQVDESFSVELKRKRHEWYFRIVNLAGISGPEHKIVIRQN